MATADPSASLSALTDSALLAAHDRLHATHKTVETLSPEETEVHHLLADELRKRGLPHPVDADGLHDRVVTMSTVRVPLAQLSKMMGPNEVNALAQMAAANGTSFADVYELLTANGWILRAEPAGPVDPAEGEGEYAGEMAEPEDLLTARQSAMYNATEKIVEMFGKFDQSAQPNGAHYAPAQANPFQGEGLICANCVAFQGGGGCEWVSGEIQPGGICKLWVIAADKVVVKERQPVTRVVNLVDGKYCVTSEDGATNFGCYDTEAEANERLAQIERFATDKAEEITYDPPRGAQEAAARALGWVKEGYAGDGFTPVGQARARDLSNGRPVSQETIMRMASFFARHAVNRQTSWELQNNQPTPWRVAWDAWGGDAGRTWAERIAEQIRTEKADTKISEGDFVRWRSSGGPAQGRVEHLMTEGTLGVPDTEFSIDASPDDPALLIRIYTRGKDGWEATETLVGHKASTVNRIESLEKQSEKSLVVKQIEEQRFTLGPWYVPNQLDAHDEWTDPDELQNALWDYVRKGNREIRLQHISNTRAGEWVEAMTLPFPLEAPLIHPETGATIKRVFPAGTVLLGVVWDDWAWDMVKRGQIRGYSIGGSSERREQDPPIMVDLQVEA
jgi:hypothetical protein